MPRFVIRIAGESGTGIESSGTILMKALKKMGYWLTADREFPSLIKGGVANYQINLADQPVRSLSLVQDIGLAVDREGVKNCLETLQPGSLLIHGFERWQRALPHLEQTAAEHKLAIIAVPASTIAKECGGSNLMINVVILGTLWQVLGFDIHWLQDELRQQFGHRATLLDVNLQCLERGYRFLEAAERVIPPVNVATNSTAHSATHSVTSDNLRHQIIRATLAKLQQLLPNPQLTAQNLLIDGNTALALGAIHAGMRAYYAYPMSPASSILSYLAKTAATTGIVVKQAEDEITAVQMALGSMHVGARALTATSGGGFDLMTETISLSGMIETPLVVVVAQRPGPATGLPTWTAQGDLNLAIYAGHGEFARIVLACSDPSSSFELIQQAFNLAESFQCPVIVLTEKTISESKVTVPDLPQHQIPMRRGLVAEPQELAELQSTDRYQITNSGVSKRWLPGSSQTIYFANSDEHGADGSLNENPDVKDMIAKRIRKLETIKQVIPEPEIFGQPAGADISFVGWGSSYNVILDAIAYFNQKQATKSDSSRPPQVAYSSQPIKLNYLHFSYLWPLQTTKLKQFFEQNTNVHLIEGNATGQLGQLIAKETGLTFKGHLLKWNGRPFYLEEVLEYIQNNC